MAFNMFPFTNLHNLNTDWILKTIKDLKAATELAASTVAGYAARLTGLEDSVVKFTPQSLTTGQKTQARSNIGAVSEADVTGTVKYNTEQQLTPEQQATARGNISAAPMIGVVYYNEAQELGDSYKAQARENIGAAAAGDVPTIEGVVRYDESQSLTNGQKTQARNNIGAMPADTVLPLEVKISYENRAYSMDQDMDDILFAIESGLPVVITCEEVSTWPGFTSFTNLRNVSISQLHVIRSGSSNDFDIVGDALLTFNDTTRELQILHLSLSILSGTTSIYPTLWGMLGAPLATEQDVGKWLKVDAYGYPVWANLPVYQGGVS